MTRFQFHPYHLVSPSPWPLFTSISVLSLVTAGVLNMHNFENMGIMLILSFFSVVFSMSLWWRDVIAEGTYMGNHTTLVQNGINLGIILFIVSEALLFFAIFWAFFHSALSPSPELGAMWPPKGITAIDPFELPLLNTVLLLSSGITVTYSHHALIGGDRKGAIWGLIATIVLAIVFTIFQGVEYIYSSFTISDGVFGSCFYFGTGLILGAPIIFNITQNITNSLSNLHPYWVTGFSDAESSFVVRIAKDNTRKFGVRILPIFTIELHIRDIEVLYSIKEFFKVGSVKLRVRDGKSTGIYTVQSIKDLVTVIIPHFTKYPLLTQKQADFILFSSVVSLINNKLHLTEEGISKIISIRASMNKGLTVKLKELFPNVVGVVRPVISNQVIKSTQWLAGFVDGEGCFYIKVTKTKKVSLAFYITQHSRDFELFNIIKDFLKCGNIESVSTRPEGVSLVVYSLQDLVSKIIPIFENSLITKKQIDLTKFKEVSSLMLNKEHLTEEGIQKILLLKKKAYPQDEHCCKAGVILNIIENRVNYKEL